MRYVHLSNPLAFPFHSTSVTASRPETIDANFRWGCSHFASGGRVWPRRRNDHSTQYCHNRICDVSLPLRTRDLRFTHLSRSFAIGLGPVPFVLIPEVAPTHVRPSNPGSFTYSDSTSRSLPRYLLWPCPPTVSTAYFSFVSYSSSSSALISGILNSIVGLVFLPLRNLLANGDPLKEGRVFYVFAGALFCTALCFSRLYRG